MHGGWLAIVFKNVPVEWQLGDSLEVGRNCQPIVNCCQTPITVAPPALRVDGGIVSAIREIFHDSVRLCRARRDGTHPGRFWRVPPRGLKAIQSHGKGAACARKSHRLLGSEVGRKPDTSSILVASAGDLKHPGYALERSTLWRAGVLAAEERTELEREWRTAFDAAHGMDARARREHSEHHDVPPELIEAWTTARKRRRRQAAASQEEAAAIK